MSYNSKYTGVEVENLLGKAGTALQEHQDISHLATKTELSKKQDTISDLATIRANADKGATALQSVPSEYVTETELSGKGYATTSALNSGLSGKVDKDGSKVLSTNDFTNALKSKLEGLSNYDDTTISNAVNKLRTDFDTLVSGDTTTAIKTFNEVIAFLDGITDTQDLESIIASIEQQIAAKQDKISDLETIRQGAAKGATALQSYTEKYTGTYSKPSGGIPKSDLASAVQTSLGKADTALQQTGGTMTGPLKLSSPMGTYISNTANFHDVAFLTKHSMDTIGTIAINFGNSNMFFAASCLIGSYNAICDIKLSGYTYTSSSMFHSPMATGTFNGIMPKFRVAVDTDGNRLFLIGETNTNWGGYLRVAIPDLTRLSTGIAVDCPNVTVSLITDETNFTYIKDVVVKNMNAVTPEEMISALDEMLSKADAASTYLSKTEASSTYLGKTDKAADATKADSATKATQDGNGNNIVNTYATKNELNGKGTYSKPSTGIPKSDLASAVQTSLGKADTALQTHQDISGKADKSSLATVATSGSYNDLTGKPTVDTSLSTSSTNAVQNKAVTAGINAKYTKPSTGIPKSDLASDVQTSLGKADTALQSYTEKYTGTYSKPSTGIPKTDLASAVQTSLGKADTALQIFTETDPVFSASAAAGIKSSDITNWNSKTSNTGTITGIKMNGASKGTSGVVDLGTVITSHQDISGKLDASTAASKYLSKTDAASTYLGKTAKAASATTADSATKATQDASGNVITSTYATKTELGGKVSSDGTILNIVKVTALPSSPDANTLYVIVES